MKIRTVLSLAVGITMLTSMVQAGILQTEDFESGTLGGGLVAEGWTGTFGEDPNIWKINTPGGTGNPTSKAADMGNPFAQVQKPFAGATGIVDTDAVFLRAFVRVGLPDTAIRAGVKAPGGLVGARIGFQGPGGAKVFTIRGADGVVTQSTTNAVDQDWYELVLNITQDAGTIGNSTGTLLARNLTAGAASLTAVPGLSNVNLGLTAANKPATWVEWYMDGVFAGPEVDELAIGTGAIPEPATIAMLIVGLGLMSVCSVRRRLGNS